MVGMPMKSQMNGEEQLRLTVLKRVPPQMPDATDPFTSISMEESPDPEKSG